MSSMTVTAVQHFDLSKILLTSYDPRIPRLGPYHRKAVRRVEVGRLQYSIHIIDLRSLGRSKYDSKTYLWRGYLKQTRTSSYEYGLYGFSHVWRSDTRQKRAAEYA